MQPKPPLRIFVADDDDTLRSLVPPLLRAGLGREYELDIEVFDSAAPLYETLSVLPSDELPHVVLTDINMPIMSGWQLAEYLKREERFADVAVVVMSDLVDGDPEGAFQALFELHKVAAAAKKPLQQDELAHAIRQALGRRTFLVASGDSAVARHLGEVLESMWHQVVITTDGPGALELLSRVPYIDYVITTTALPFLDGFGLLERIRADDRWRGVRVLVAIDESLDARTQVVNGQLAKSLGAKDFILVPTRPTVLAMKIAFCEGGEKDPQPPSGSEAS